MAEIFKPEHSTIGTQQTLKEISKRIYDDDEIKEFNMMEAINEHPLAKRPKNIRSKLAYKELLNNATKTTKYLLPGSLCMFYYQEPKLKEELEYYDATPMTLFVGITRTKDNNIREIGINLHYFPPFTRARIIEHSYEVFRPWFDKNFNEITGKPNTFISYKALTAIMKRNTKLAFGIKMYIPVLRGASWVIPTRLFPTAFFTEGHFSHATLAKVFHFWRQFKQ